MHLKKTTSATFGKITGRGVKVDISTLSYFLSIIYVKDEDDDDFESPAPTNSCQQERTRITRSQTKKVDKLVKNIKTRTKKCGRAEKAKVSLKLADEVEDDSAKVKKREKLKMLLKICVEDDATVYDKPSENMLVKAYFQGNKSITRQQLLDRFKEKKWESDGDVFKMTLMVFIQHFSFKDTNDHCFTKANFDIVESGEYQSYAWEKML
ncbi:hypothetical protein RND71_017001 [Anisodus tanguticus]|uniref:DUF1985 domain-containing protein n=1 Tax=Anisodus tanguticus TaxID=243964 RepID=A0AAE1S1K1_9SOLA|nr:hypothetical protein RND71_017001 [Anisodus tanguticus]